jgi:hypothetical protein
MKIHATPPAWHFWSLTIQPEPPKNTVSVWRQQCSPHHAMGATAQLFSRELIQPIFRLPPLPPSSKTWGI